MPKEFYTEKDIEDLSKRGVRSLEVNDNVVLTELAYEKARQLGMQMDHSQPDNPPSAPVRPYLSQKQAQPQPIPTVASELQQRIRTAVTSRLSTAIDPELLDEIIQRVLKSTGPK